MQAPVLKTPQNTDPFFKEPKDKIVAQVAKQFAFRKFKLSGDNTSVIGRNCIADASFVRTTEKNYFQKTKREKIKMLNGRKKKIKISVYEHEEKTKYMITLLLKVPMDWYFKCAHGKMQDTIQYIEEKENIIKKVKEVLEFYDALVLLTQKFKVRFADGKIYN